MTPIWYRRVITEGMTGDDVSVVRRKLGLTDGPYDKTTMTRLAGMSRKQSTKFDGRVSPAVAEMLGESEANLAGLVPAWYKRELGPKDMFSASGEDVRQLRGRLALDIGDDRYTPEVEDAIRRFQSHHKLTPNGVMDEDLARLLG